MRQKMCKSGKRTSNDSKHKFYVVLFRKYSDLIVSYVVQQLFGLGTLQIKLEKKIHCYCVSKKQLKVILFSKLIYKMGHYFLGIHYFF